MAYAPRQIGTSRRDLIQAAAGSLVLGWPTMSGALRAAPSSARASGGRAKACIVLFMWGGPAQQDTWDMKPSAPSEFRGQFQPISTTVPGLQICEHLPLLAARAYGQGKALVWTSDIGPHWCPEPFVTWPGYGQLWLQTLAWLAS